MAIGKRIDLYVAKESFTAILDDGERIHLTKGDLVRADHPVLKHRTFMFLAAPERVRFDVETTTAIPGQLR